MHPNEPLLDVAEYKCEECGSVFQQRSHLTAHVKLQHCPKSTMYQCSSCASQFTNKVCTFVTALSWMSDMISWEVSFNFQFLITSHSFFSSEIFESPHAAA